MKIGNCDTLIASERTRATIVELESEKNVKVIDASKFKDFLSRKPWDGRLEFLENCRSAVREDDTNVIILHSSGTTGQPKLISLTHRYVLGYAGCHEFADTMDMSQRGFNVSTLPLFHVSSFLFST
jgi:long-subunit acyl-CoA synthetase (AMP-forming)